MGSLPYTVTLIIRQLDSFGIPAFLFVSGFFVAFLAKGRAANVTWPAIRSRIQKLLPPFLIWTLVLLLLVTGGRLWRADMVDILRTYYYIPLILQFYVLAPLLVPLAKRYPLPMLAAAASIQLGVQSLSYFRALGLDFAGLDLLIRATPLWFFPGRLFYFCLGLVASLHLSVFKDWLGRTRWALAGAAVLFAVLTVAEVSWVTRLSGARWLGPTFNGFSRTLYATAFILAFLSFEHLKLPGTQRLRSIGAQSLGVYLLNAPVLYVVASLMYHLTPALLGRQLIYQGILVLTGLGLPLLFMAVVRGSPARRMYPYLFG